MADIHIFSHPHIPDVMIFDITGDLTADQFLSTKVKHYGNPNVVHCLWDFTKGSIHHISTHEFKLVLSSIMPTQRNRHGVCTAMVFPVISDFGLGRMYLSFAQVMDIRITYYICRAREEADIWLRATHKPTSEPSENQRLRQKSC